MKLEIYLPSPININSLTTTPTTTTTSSHKSNNEVFNLLPCAFTFPQIIFHHLYIKFLPMYPPPPLLPLPHLTPFMELKKSRSAAGSFREFDELAMVKAAAWAWFQHGSGSEGKPMTELHVERTQRKQFRPSRYKLEAMRMVVDGQEMINRNGNSNIAVDESSLSSSSETPSPFRTDHDNSLLDSYEIQCISRQLNSFISDSTGSTSSFHDGGNRRYPNVSGVGDRSRNGRKMNYMSKILKGILLRQAAVCGRREDVDTRAFRDDRRRRKPPARGAISMVKTAN